MGTTPTAFHVELCSAQLCQRRLFLPRADQEEPLQRLGNRNWLSPTPSLHFLDLVDVTAADPKHSLARGNAPGVRPAQKLAKFSQCARTNNIDRCNLLSQLLVPTDQNSGVSKTKFKADL